MLGPEGLDHLRQQCFEERSPPKRSTQLECSREWIVKCVEKMLPARMKEWKRTAHDRVVRQIAVSGAVERGRLLLELFDLLDSADSPTRRGRNRHGGEQSADMRLLRLAEGDLPSGRYGLFAVEGNRGSRAAPHNQCRRSAPKDFRGAQSVPLGESERAAGGGGPGHGKNRPGMGAQLYSAQRSERGGILDRTAGRRSGIFSNPPAPLSALAAGAPDVATTTNLKDNCQMPKFRK